MHTIKYDKFKLLIKCGSKILFMPSKKIEDFEKWALRAFF